MKKIGLVVVAAMAMIFVAACSSVQDLGRFTVISSKNVELSKLGQMMQDSKVQETSKNALNLKIFWFIQTKRVSTTYELENALDAVVEKVPGGVALVNAKLQYVVKRGFLGFTKRWGYVFTGNVLYDEKSFNAGKTSSLQIDDDNTLYAVLENNSEDIKFVSKEEFDKIASVK